MTAPDAGSLPFDPALVGFGRVPETDDAVFRDIGGYASRGVPLVLAPRTAAEVQAAVRGAARRSLLLHPFSTGRNWGLGSRKPAQDGSTALDLSGLSAVRALDLTYGTAVIEPGVSQSALAARLQDTPWRLNLTGSSADSSVLGNLLERGQGYTRSRIDELIGLEVVLPTGDLVRLGGFWERAGADRRPFHYRHGLGPDLTGLFVQSGLGIVTAAAIALVRRPETTRILRCRLRGDRLGAAIDAVRGVYEANLLTSIGKGFLAASLDSLKQGPNHYGQELHRQDFVLYSAYDGRAAVADAVAGEATRLLEASGAVADIRFFDAAAADAKDAAVEDIDRDMAHTFTGVLDSDHFDEIFGTTSDRLDHDAPQGWLFFLPVFPAHGADAEAAVALFHDTVAGQPVTGNMTLNFLSDRTIDMVASLVFPRTAEGETAAHRTLDRLHEAFAARGLLPYRIDIDRAARYQALADPAYRTLLRRLRHGLDPDGVMAAGRYLPPA